MILDLHLQRGLLFTLFFFLLHCVACGILVPWLGMEAVPLHWKHEVLHWTAREFPLSLLLVCYIFLLLATDLLKMKSDHDVSASSLL